MRKDLLREMIEHSRVQIINGLMYTELQPPSARHTILQSDIYDALNYTHGKRSRSKKWVFLLEVHIDVVANTTVENDRLVPDIAGWTLDRFNSINTSKTYIDVMPDWVCEVVSKSSVRIDHSDKLEKYESLGVSYYWILDPLQNTIEVYELKNKKYELTFKSCSTSTFKAPPFFVDMTLT